MWKKLIIFVFNYIVSLRWILREISIHDQVRMIKEVGFIFLYRSLLVRLNYHRTKKRLNKEKNRRKIRVCFLVSETSKWNMQSLYDKLFLSDLFYPFIVVTNFMKTENRQSYDHILNFYKNTAANVEIGWDEESKQGIDLRTFSPDIVFYQQPWGLFDNQDVLYVSNFALTYSISYAIEEFFEAISDLVTSFHALLTNYFVFSEYSKKYLESKASYAIKNIIATGHPKLETYFDYHPQDYQHSYVVYAPHHSFANSILRYGTFPWSGIPILEWAKAHSDVKWVFKPHPRLKISLLEEGIMNQIEIDEYYNEWSRIGVCYDDGNYFDIFKNSKCLITDSGSFLMEYLPTQMPIIHLRNNSSKGFAPTISVIIESYYKAYDIDELNVLLDNVVIKGIDPKKEERCKLINELGLINTAASENIIKEIRNQLSC